MISISLYFLQQQLDPKVLNLLGISWGHLGQSWRSPYPPNVLLPAACCRRLLSAASADLRWPLKAWLGLSTLTTFNVWLTGGKKHNIGAIFLLVRANLKKRSITQNLQKNQKFSKKTHKSIIFILFVIWCNLEPPNLRWTSADLRWPPLNLRWTSADLRWPPLAAAFFACFAKFVVFWNLVSFFTFFFVFLRFFMFLADNVWKRWKHALVRFFWLLACVGATNNENTNLHDFLGPFWNNSEISGISEKMTSADLRWTAPTDLRWFPPRPTKQTATDRPNKRSIMILRPRLAPQTSPEAPLNPTDPPRDPPQTAPTNAVSRYCAHGNPKTEG